MEGQRLLYLYGNLLKLIFLFSVISYNFVQ